MAEQETLPPEASPQKPLPANRRSTLRHLRVLLIALFATLLLRAFLFEVVTVPSSSMEDTLLPGDFMLCSKAGYSLQPEFVTPLFGLSIPLPNLFGERQLHRNSVIIFSGTATGPQDGFRAGEYYIKRIAALPGDTLKIKHGTVSINGSNEEELPTGKHTERMLFEGDPENGIFPEGSKWNEDFYGPVIIPGKGVTIPINDSTLALYSGQILRELPNASLYSGKLSEGGKNLTTYTFRENYYFVLGDSRNNSKDSRYNGFIPRSSILAAPLFIYLSIDSDSPSLSDRIRFSRIGKGIK